MEPHAQEEGQKNEKEGERSQPRSKTDQNLYNEKSISSTAKGEKQRAVNRWRPREGSSQKNFDEIACDLQVNELLIIHVVSSRRSGFYWAPRREAIWGSNILLITE